MSVYTATQSELEHLGEAAVGSVEGQTALALAAALDDRAGIQAGGLASTAKQLAALMDTVRERHKKPEGKTTLELLRGGAGAAG